jgi:transcriptional regulator with XRE-family HTH domain
MDIRRVFGANVRRYRLAARLSQEAVAERMGVDRAHVSAIERGLQNATLLTILQAAHALSVRPAELLEDGVPNVKS